MLVNQRRSDCRDGADLFDGLYFAIEQQHLMAKFRGLKVFLEKVEKRLDTAPPLWYYNRAPCVRESRKCICQKSFLRNFQKTLDKPMPIWYHNQVASLRG